MLIATSGQAALNIVERVTPDLILLDAVMPGLDGFETCLRLKANAAVAQVPVIFMTGLTEPNMWCARSNAAVWITSASRSTSTSFAPDYASTSPTRDLLKAPAWRWTPPVATCWRCAPMGTILWSTPQATRLINAATGSNDGLDIVSRTIGDWMAQTSARDTPLVITHAERPSLQFTFLGAVGADEYLFRLTTTNEKSGDALLRDRFSLTTRESEVLVWIAKGKSNRDIGEILGLSARTVNKHLEQIYV